MKKLLLTLLFTKLLLSDYTVSYQFDEGSDMSLIETMQYKDSNNIKLSYHYSNDNSSIEETGLYRILGKNYIVSYRDKKLTYTDVIFDDSTSDNDNSPKQPFFKLIKKLDKEYIAGFNGEIWLVESTEDGKTEQEKIVICSNKELVNAVKDYFKIMRDFGEGASGQEFDEELESMFMVKDGYVLIAADGIELVKFEKNSISSKVFTLPKGVIKYKEED
ncbi:hypothetical protein MNB_SV-9-911 [hydrothermal vent metagenome]|uniref:DUF4412 domain-containing protein n=1 Tax=hydrothermal vent metagenome TaxID=652676 RepID=A0A1W1C9M1_9ZZZZ